VSRDWIIGHEWEWNVKRLDFTGTSGSGVSRDWILRARVGLECQETGFHSSKKNSRTSIGYGQRCVGEFWVGLARVNF
jgi:hypothetical protein